MSIQRPSILVPELLSQVPSNLYEQTYHRFQPVNPPQDGVNYRATQATELVMNISVPPNEYVDFSKAHFSVGVISTVKVGGPTNIPYNGPGNTGIGAVNDGDKADLLEKIFVKNYVLGRRSTRLDTPHYRWGPWVVDRVEESVNTGSLKLEQSTDSQTKPAYDAIKAMCAKRSYDVMDDAVEDLHKAGCAFSKQRQGFNVLYQSQRNDPGTAVTIRGKPSHYQIPLSMMSELARTPALCGLGFFSSISVNAYQMRITLPRISSEPGTGNLVLPATPATLLRNVWHPIGTQHATLVTTVTTDGYYSPEIYLPTVRNLSSETQELFDSLFSKRVSQDVGGVSVPLSLRYNTLGNRHFGVYNLPTAQGQHHFDLPTTDPSVRALAYMIFDAAQTQKHFTNDANQATLDVGVANTAPTYPGTLVNVPDNQVRVTELEVHIGTRNLTNGCVRDTRVQDSHVADFLALQGRRSGACFSAFNYWQENNRGNKDEQGDLRKDIQHGIPDCEPVLKVSPAAATNNSAGKNHSIDSLVPAGGFNCQYGVVSLENSNHDGDDLLDSTKATGMNLNNIGSVRVRMGISHVTAATGELAPGPGTGSVGKAVSYVPDYRIVWMASYDKILEVSPSGVSLIQNEVLGF